MYSTMLGSIVSKFVINAMKIVPNGITKVKVSYVKIQDIVSRTL